MGKMGFGGFSKPSLFGGFGNNRSTDKRHHDRDDDHRDDDHDRHDRKHHADDDDRGKPQWFGNHWNDHGKAHGNKDDSCGPDDDHPGGNHGGGTTAPETEFAAIPADTTGVTFHVDLNADGVMDEYAYIKAPDGADPAAQTMQDYYDAVYTDLKADHPEANPNQIVVKATIYSASEGESYQYFDGTQTSSDEQAADNDDTDEDDHGDDDHGPRGDNHGDDGEGDSCKDDDRDDDDDKDEDQEDDGIGSHGNGCQTGGSDDDDEDDGAQHAGDIGAAFYAEIMALGDAPPEDDHGDQDEPSDEDQSDAVIFC